MGLLDRARLLLSSPASRRLNAAAVEAWGSAPKPSAALALRASVGPPPPRTPPINWWQEQPPNQPSSYVYQPGYSNHIYQQQSAPLGFEGFGLDRIRMATAAHRLGNFYESSALMVAILGFAPVLAALQQAIAPILALSRHVHGGEKGLAKLVASEVEEALVPRGGLLPSPCLPPALWGTMAIYLRMMGFCVLQHVDGDPDPETGVRPRFTRIWEPWAVQRMRSPRKTIAYTTEGPVEVCNDGKFTLVEDEQEGYLSAAILALGEETFAGKLTQEARLSFLDFFGKPKLWAMPPEKQATHGEVGNAFVASIETIYGPDGRGVLPFGSKLDAVSISGEGSKAFQEALVDAIIHIFMVLTGSAGTIGAGGATGAGPYQPQKGGVWNVRHDLIARPTIAIVRAINQGHIAPYCDMNYADGIAKAMRAGVWKYPVLSIPIPAPDRDERIAAEITRQKALSDQLIADREAGAIVDQARVDKLSERFEALGFALADPKPKGGEIYQYHIETKQVATDEVRDRLGFEPLPNGVGSVEQLAKDRATAAAQAEATARSAENSAKQTAEPPPEPVAGADGIPGDGDGDGRVGKAEEQDGTAAAAFLAVADTYIRHRLTTGATATELQKETAALAALVGAP